MHKGEYPMPMKKSEEISLTDLINIIKSILKYIRSKWLVIMIVAVIGALLGLGYSVLKKPRYTAVCSFVLEDGKVGGGGSQFAGLASLAGINIGGTGGGIFQGDNILELYKSRLMIEKTLLTRSEFDGKKQLLIERFIERYKLREKWVSEDGLQNIHFEGNPDKFNRKQDSIITDLVDLFNTNILNVSKPDKKLSIIIVEATTKDEQFSKIFTDQLVQNVNEFYTQTKTKKANQNVQSLQHQADSVKRILNSSINGVANANDSAPNANPEMSTLKVASQKRQVDVQANGAIYAEMVKNLEIEKLTLRQDMPLIQVIDHPVLPLKITRTTKFMGTIIGMALGAIFCICVLIGRKILKHFR